MDVLDILDRQPADHGGVALDQVLEAVGYAEHFDPVVDRFDSRRADDAIDPGCRTAADQERHFPDLFAIAHTVRSPRNQNIPEQITDYRERGRQGTPVAPAGP